jgi:hypothetical protein
VHSAPHSRAAEGSRSRCGDRPPRIPEA